MVWFYLEYNALLCANSNVFFYFALVVILCFTGQVKSLYHLAAWKRIVSLLIFEMVGFTHQRTLGQHWARYNSAAYLLRFRRNLVFLVLNDDFKQQSSEPEYKAKFSVRRLL